jgi:hypothetical protein
VADRAAADERTEPAVDALRDELARLWQRTPPELPVLGPRTGWLRRLSNERAARQLVDALASEAARLPPDEVGRRAWRESVAARLAAFAEERLGCPPGAGRSFPGDAFLAASVDFAREARAFDPALPVESLGQALRNVWIGNNLQLRLGLPVALGEGLFGYSMLYPITDNLLDDPAVDAAAKRAFNRRFRRRLAGEEPAPQTSSEAAAFAMVARVESELPRDRFPGVFERLLAIHDAQARSLRQQDDPQLCEDELLSISCEKGGASVLADLYLAAGTATEADRRFAFGYGVFLQLLDDLQDVEADLAASHQTLFTRSARLGPLDEAASRLAWFVDRVLDAEPAADAEDAARREITRRSCRALLVSAVAAQPRRFRWRFRRAIERQWPFSLGALRRLRARTARRFAAIQDSRSDPSRHRTYDSRREASDSGTR